MIHFSQTDMFVLLEPLSQDSMDTLPFGVIKLDKGGNVLAYNRYEIEAMGLSRERVLGKHFFTEVGGCMNNSQVAGRFKPHQDLDVEIDYVFAVRLMPEPVRLRLLTSSGSQAMYLLVQRFEHGHA